MFTRKRTITAIQVIIDNLINPGLKNGGIYKIGQHSTCPLCDIYYCKTAGYEPACRGCPFADSSGDIGCIDLKSYRYLVKAGKVYGSHPNGITYLQTIYMKQAIKLRKIKEYLRKLPATRFSPEGWKYINWNKVAKEIGVSDE